MTSIDKKKILMVMPSLPFPESGAEQSDRAHGIRQLVRLGYDVRAIVKLPQWKTKNDADVIAAKLGIKIIGVPYRYSNRTLTWKDTLQKNLRKLANPLLLDGAALEYAENVIQKVFKEEVISWKPDIAWFEYTYLWPLYAIAKKRGVKIVTRSINFEPSHFLQEDGRSFLNILKALPKFASENRVARESDALFAITPDEENIYRRVCRGRIRTLPLRGLHQYLNKKAMIRNQSPLHVVFMGSTYSVSHNRAALEYLLSEIIPRVNEKEKEAWHFHILGGKAPAPLVSNLPSNVAYHGYVDDLDKMLDDMDVALIPSLMGAGMQQKIFEPLSRGMPTVTSKRGLAGYPYRNGEELFLEENAEEFAEALFTLKDASVRKKLSEKAQTLSRKLFSMEIIDATVRTALQDL